MLQPVRRVLEAHRVRDAAGGPDGLGQEGHLVGDLVRRHAGAVAAFVVRGQQAVRDDARVALDHVDGVVQGGEDARAGEGGGEGGFFVGGEGGGRPCDGVVVSG